MTDDTCVQEHIESWFCEKCPQNNNEDCGPWEENSKLFNRIKIIHNKHQGWRKRKQKKDGFNELIQNVVQKFDESQQRIEKLKSLPVDAYQLLITKEFEELKEIIDSNFKNRSSVIETCLSVRAQLKIEGITQVFALIIMGKPSSYKSTILEILSSLNDSYVSDAFTPKSFVSHSANSKKTELEKIDLLPRIKHKILVTPELAPLFSGNPDQLVEHFGILTRILDGRGYQSDSGIHGKRGYVGDYSFMWLGAVVDIPHRVWKLLGNLGAKMYFLRLPDDVNSIDKKIKQIKNDLKDESYNRKLESCKIAIRRFWFHIECRSFLHDSKIVWDKQKDDDEAIERIIQLAVLLSKLRGTIPTWGTHGTDSGGSNYHYEKPIVEEPNRASHALYNLARGHAVILGRNFISKDDLGVVIPVALSSASSERFDLFRYLVENDGRLSTDDFMRLAKVSRATALKNMTQLQILELVDMYDEEGSTKPISVVKLRNEYSWFISSEFKKNLIAYQNSLNPKNSKLSQQENLEKNMMRNLDTFTEKNNFSILEETKS